jgi:hypothetical protein
VAYGGCERVATIKSPKTYDKDGIHFQHPGNWKVTADSQRDGVRYLFLETPGQATVTIQIYLATEALEIEEFARGFSSIVRQELPKYVAVGNSTFGAPEDVSGYKSITEQFSISALGQEVPTSALTNKNNSATTSFTLFARFLMKMRTSSLSDSIKSCRR